MKTSRKKAQKGNKHLKKYSVSLSARECQINLQWDTSIQPLEWLKLKLKEQQQNTVSKDVVYKLELSYY